MTEGKLLAAWKRLSKYEMPGSVVLKHNDPFTSGVPDVTVSLRLDSWLEFKYGAKIKWKNDLQWLTCSRLARATGRCWVVFYRDDDGLATFIVLASDVDRHGNFNRVAAQLIGRFDHRFVWSFLRNRHAA